MPIRDDETLLHLYAREGDEAAFRELARRHGGLVYAACLREARRPELAEDAAQSVFLDLARKAGRIRVKSSLVPWLYAASRLAGRKAARAESRRPTLPLERSVPAPPEPEPDDALLAALDALSGPEREAVVLRFLQGLSLAEVGRAQGVSEDAARMRVKRALARLRTEYVPALVTPSTLTARLATLALPKPSPIMNAPFLLALGGALAVGGAAATTLRRPSLPDPNRPSAAPAQAAPAKVEVFAVPPSRPPESGGRFPALTNPFTLVYRFTERDQRPKAMREEDAAINRKQMEPQVDAGHMTPQDMEASLARIRQLRPPYSKDVTVSFDGRTLYLESQGGGQGMVFLVRGKDSYRFPQNEPHRSPEFHDGYYLYLMPVPIVGASLPYLPFVQGGKTLAAEGAPMADGKPIYSPGWVETRGGKAVRIVNQWPGEKRAGVVTTLSGHRQVGGAMVAGSVVERSQAQDGQVVQTQEFRLVSASDRPLPADRFVPESYLPEKTDVMVYHDRGARPFPYERAKGPVDGQVRAFLGGGVR